MIKKGKHFTESKNRISRFNLNLAVQKQFDSSILKFNLTKEMAGTYKCESSNLAGRISKKIAINFNGKF